VEIGATDADGIDADLNLLRAGRLDDVFADLETVPFHQLSDRHEQTS